MESRLNSLEQEIETCERKIGILKECDLHHLAKPYEHSLKLLRKRAKAEAQSPPPKDETPKPIYFSEDYPLAAKNTFEKHKRTYKFPEVYLVKHEGQDIKGFTIFFQKPELQPSDEIIKQYIKGGPKY